MPILPFLLKMAAGMQTTSQAANRGMVGFGFCRTITLFPRTTTSILSPGFTPKASRASRGITIWFLLEMVTLIRR
jgi:hypothetical protein